MAELRGMLSGFGLVLAGLLLAISVDFGVPGQPLLGSLRFHIGVAALLLPLAMVLAGARLRASIVLALVLASLGQGLWIVAGLQQPRAAFDGRQPLAELKVISFNVLADNLQSADLVRALEAEAPDIAIIMEAPGIERSLDSLAATFPYRAGCTRTASCDTMILSRLPLTGIAVRRLMPFNRERLITAQAESGGVTFSIMALHLSKPYFDTAMEFELAQAASVMSSLPGPLVLAGDFNAAAWSREIVSVIEERDLIAPPRLPATWPVELGDFGLPIDNIFTRGSAMITAIEPLAPIGSNHRGLRASVAFY